MIRLQFQIRCSFKKWQRAPSFEKVSKHTEILEKHHDITFTPVTVLFEKKAWTGYMIFRYTPVFESSLVTRSRISGLFDCFRSQISDISQVHPSTESCFLPAAHSFIPLVAQNRSIGINTARLDEEKVYVVNFES